MALAGFLVELGHGESQSATPVTKDKGRKRKKPQHDENPDSELANFMKYVANSMRSGSGTTEEPRSLKRSRLGENRKACIESLMNLLAQNKSI